MEPGTHDWMGLIKEMLWIVEREVKSTLRGVNDSFKITGLTFDDDFRNHFVQIVHKR